MEGSQEEGTKTGTGVGQDGGMSGGRAEKCTRAKQGASGGRPGEQAEACSGEDKDEVDGGDLLEGLQGLEGGTPLEGKVEGGPLLEGLEGLEEGHPREGVGFRNRTGLGDRSQLRGWRELWNRMAHQTHHPHSDGP